MEFCKTVNSTSKKDKSILAQIFVQWSYFLTFSFLKKLLMFYLWNSKMSSANAWTYSVCTLVVRMFLYHMYLPIIIWQW